MVHKSILLQIIASLISLSSLGQAVSVSHAAREIDMGQTDMMMVRTIFTFDAEGQTKFKFAIAKDFEDSLVKVNAQTNLQEKDNEKFMKRVPSEHNGAIVYEYDFARLADQLKKESGDGNNFRIQINEFYKRRMSPFPAELKMMQKHVFKVQDSAFIFSPYKIQSQTTSIIGERRNFKGFTQLASGLFHQDEEKLYYGPFDNAEPFEWETVTFFMTKMMPQVAFTNVVRDIQVSAWGSISVNEHFEAENMGAKIKGEFYHNQIQQQDQRIQVMFEHQSHGCQEFFQSSYPWYIRDLYFNDVIGNLTTSNALRRETSVDVRMRTRFPLCGGWKTNWDQGYSLPTKYHMRESTDQNDQYMLEMPLMHAYEGFIADNFTLTVTLPTGASDIKVEISDLTSFTYFTDNLYFGTLDFIGRPQVRINLNNANAVMHSKDFRLKFKMDMWSIIQKPVALSLVLFGFLFAFIVINRFQLPIDNEDKSAKIKTN